MNLKQNSVYGWVSAAIISLVVFACSENDGTGLARVEVRLTDAPADYQEANIDIQEVQVHTQDGDPSSGWQSLDINEGRYNLLEFTNGLDVLLGSIELPAGKISQIRLVLGDSNTVKVNDQLIRMETPSAQQSGLKVQLHMDLTAGITYSVLLDFDAARSIIVETGNAKYILKPVIRAVADAQDGAIKGLVDPVDSSPVVHAIIGTGTEADTVSTSANASGDFMVRGLSAGTYRVVFVPQAGFQTKEVADVAVTLGLVTDLGTVDLQ